MLHFATVRLVRTKMRQQTDNNQRGGGMRVLVMKRMRVGNQYPIDVMDVGKRRYTCLVRYKECQQA